MSELPTYGECGCGGTYVLDPTTVDDRLVDFPCENDDCDWGRTVAREHVDAWADEHDVDVDSLGEQPVATDGGREQCVACGHPYDRREHAHCPNCENSSLDEYMTDGGRLADDTLDGSFRTLDLRLAIGAYYDLGFEARVRDSNSNSTAAIYFRADDIEVIAADLGVDTDGDKRAVMDRIREACDCPPRGVRGFDWVELKAIIDTVGIPVEIDAVGMMPGGEADATETPGGAEAAVADGGPEQRGPWSDWGGDV